MFIIREKAADRREDSERRCGFERRVMTRRIEFEPVDIDRRMGLRRISIRRDFDDRRQMLDRRDITH